jgi:ribosomal protein S10
MPAIASPKVRIQARIPIPRTEKLNDYPLHRSFSGGEAKWDCWLASTCSRLI